MNKEEKLADYNKRAEVQEAVNVAADLLAIERGIALTETTVTVPADPKKKAQLSIDKNAKSND